MFEPLGSSPAHRALQAQAALADALALTTAARGPVDEAAALIMSEYLVLSTSEGSLRSQPERAEAPLTQLFVGCAFLAQLLRTLTDAPLEAADEVWGTLEELEDHLQRLVVEGGPSSPLTSPGSLPEHSSTQEALDGELRALLAGTLSPAPSLTPANAAAWAVALYRLNLPVTTPALTFALLRAGFETPEARGVPEAVQHCVNLGRRDPPALVRAAVFQLLLAAWVLRSLADACAQARGRAGEELLAELGALLARRRGQT